MTTLDKQFTILQNEARKYGKQVGREIEDNSMSVEDRLLSGGALKLIEAFSSHFAKGVAEVTGQDRKEIERASLRAVRIGFQRQSRSQ